MSKPNNQPQDPNNEIQETNNQPEAPAAQEQETNNQPEPLTTENFLLMSAEVLMPLLERIEHLEQRLEQSQQEQTQSLQQQQETFLRDLTQLLNSRKSSDLQKQLSALSETLNNTCNRIDQQVKSDERLNSSIEKLQHTLDNRKLEIY